MATFPQPYVTRTASRRAIARFRLVLWRDVVRLVGESVLPLEQALTLATTNVARVLGLDQTKGRIAAGFDADFSLIDENHTIRLVVAAGRVVFRAEGSV